MGAGHVRKLPGINHRDTSLFGINVALPFFFVSDGPEKNQTVFVLVWGETFNPCETLAITLFYFTQSKRVSGATLG